VQISVSLKKKYREEPEELCVRFALNFSKVLGVIRRWKADGCLFDLQVKF
jgi:hypothetical protein